MGEALCLSPDAAYLVQGPCRLRGVAHISGAKNAVLPILAATLLTEEDCVLDNCPHISDVSLTLALLQDLGKEVDWQGERLRIREHTAPTAESLGCEAGRMRASVLLAGALLGRCGQAKTPHPGGCAIGERPIDLHLTAFRALGVQICEENACIDCRAQHLCGADIHLPFPSVGATENAMLAAVLAEGETRIYGAAQEPEIEDLAAFLNAMGAQVTGAGTDYILIHGKTRLGGATHRVIPDRIEAATYLAAAAITGGEVFAKGARAEHLAAVLDFFRQTGCLVQTFPDGIWLKAPKRLCPADIQTGPYPAFPTDAQPLAMALLTLADGTSMIKESIFENRFRQAEGLSAMGARIQITGNLARIQGVPALTAAAVAAEDLRGGAALILAALAAQGESRITGVSFVERGYQNILQKLTALGGCASVSPSPEVNHEGVCP